MKNAPRLYDVVLEFIRQCPWSDKRHALLLAWMVVGMVEAGYVNLSHWISSVETGAEYAQSTQRRFSRWIHNPRALLNRGMNYVLESRHSRRFIEPFIPSFSNATRESIRPTCIDR